MRYGRESGVTLVEMMAVVAIIGLIAAISFPAVGNEPVRVYEVEVRPKDMGRPGFLGSIFLDQRSGAIVRMNFTFTAASYVDSYLDYIRISLDNSLLRVLCRTWIARSGRRLIR